MMHLVPPSSNTTSDNHSGLFAGKQNRINDIESFESQAKRHLRKSNEILKEHFHLFLEKCGWCFKHSNLKSKLNKLEQ
jgi:transposase